MSPTPSGPSRATTNSNSPVNMVALICLVAVLSYLAAELGRTLVLRPQMVWPVWPGCAMLVALLLLMPRRAWLALLAAGLLGFGIYDLHEGLPLHSIGLLLLSDAIEVLIVTLGVSYSIGDSPRLNSIKSLARYSFFAVVLAPIVSAFVATAAFSVNYWIRWRIGFFTEALAFLTFAPAILGWVNARREWTPKSRTFYLEAATLIGGLIVLGYIAFVSPVGISPPVLLYSLLPFLLWSALRFGSVGISTSMTVVAFLSVWGAIHGRGPFTRLEPLENVMALQLFLFFAAATFMVLAVVVEEQKHTERAFRESEKRFRLVADTAPVLIWMSETDRLCTYFNKPWLDFTGRSIESERGNGWVERVHPEDLGRCLETYTRAFDRREEFRMEYRLRRHDGEYRWILDIGVPRFNEECSFIGYIGVGVDVSERRQAEQELQKSEERFRLAAQAGKMFAYEWDAATDEIVRAGACAEILGMDRLVPVTTGREILAKVYPDDREKLLAADAALSPERPHLHVSHRMIRPDGSVIWLERTGRAHFDEQGKVLRIVGMVANITERRDAEEELQKSEARFRLAAKAGRMFAYEWDAATDVIVRSTESAHILGIDSAIPITGQQILAKVFPDDREKLIAAVTALSPEQPHLRITYRMVRPDGAVIWVERNSTAHFDDQGKVLKIVGMVADVTQRMRTEEALRESEERLRLAVQAGRMYAFEWDPATDLMVLSSESRNILKWPLNPTWDTGRQFLAALHPDDREIYNATEARLTPASPTYQIAFRVLRPDGAVTWLEESGRAVFDTQGRMVRVVGMGADITDRKRAEEVLSSISRRLIEAQEQERTRIARELHDDIGQRLALLAVELQQIHEETIDSGEVHGRMGELQKQAEDIATDIQALSHELHSAKLEYLGIVAAMRSFCQEFAKQTKVKVDFKSHDLPSPLPPDTSLCLFRVLQEALHNSVKHSGVKQVEVGLWETSDEVHLTVSDFGAGFDSETVKEIRGLGLINMEERLKLLNGIFSIESQPKHGTTIHAQVPLRPGSDSMRAAG